MRFKDKYINASTNYMPYIYTSEFFILKLKLLKGIISITFLTMDKRCIDYGREFLPKQQSSDGYCSSKHAIACNGCGFWVCDYHVHITISGKYYSYSTLRNPLYHVCSGCLAANKNVKYSYTNTMQPCQKFFSPEAILEAKRRVDGPMIKRAK